MNLFVQESAERDILRQVEWYAEQGAFDIALRFSAATADSIKSVMAMPEGGAPKATANSELAHLACRGLR